MREMVIQYSPDEGEWLRDIDEKRKYFLSEAEMIIQAIRKRNEKEKREIGSVPFRLFVDGKEIMIAHIDMTSHQYTTIQEQIVATMKKHEAWKEEVRHQYVNKVNEYAEQERLLFLSNEFKAFAIRMEECMDSDFNELSLAQIKILFDHVYSKISAVFFSRMEDIVHSILESYKTVLHYLNVEKEGDLEEIQAWWEDETHFQKFAVYVSANYLSVPRSRLEAILVKLPPYQQLQDELFIEFASSQGFQAALAKHENAKQQMNKRWDQILFQGFALENEEMVSRLVITPVISEYLKNKEE